jgi:hypothetical protein
MKRIGRIAAFFYSAVLLLFNTLTLSASAEVRLPDGTAAGLPEKLTVMDSDGNSVNSSGEYFFEVEDMQPYTDYSKDIQIMNLREDKAYHIYFYAQPIGSSGEIDLENDSTAVFTLDGEKVFEGKVTGEATDGGENISDTPIDLGLYEPGDSRKLNCTVTWSGTSAGDFIDYGHRLIDTEGEHILRGKSGDDTIEGEVTFRWVFYAVLDENYTPPNTGIFGTDSRILTAAIFAAALAVFVMIILVIRKKKKKNTKATA